MPSKSKQKRDTKISNFCLSRLGVRVYRRSQKVLPISWSLKENFGGSGDPVEQLPAKKPLLPIFSQVVWPSPKLRASVVHSKRYLRESPKKVDIKKSQLQFSIWNNTEYSIHKLDTFASLNLFAWQTARPAFFIAYQIVVRGRV